MDEIKIGVIILIFIITISFITSIIETNIIRKKKRENLERRQKNEEMTNSQININNNRHSYMYQDVGQEIIKVDHAFSKEVFLNNAKELFLKYHNCMVNGEPQELKEYTTASFFECIQDKINYNNQNNIDVVISNIYIYNAFLYEFSKSTDNQVITVKLKTEMKTYEINNKTQMIIKGNKYAKVDFDYKMQFERKTKDIKCQNCGASVNMNDLSKCGYCGSVIEVEDNEWKLNYINILKD